MSLTNRYLYLKMISEVSTLKAAERVEDIHIKYKNITRYAVVTKDGSKYIDNDTVFHLILDLAIDGVDEQDKDIIIEVFNKANAKYAEKNDRTFFYLCKEELDTFWNSMANSIHKLVYANFVCDTSRFLFDTIHKTELWEKMENHFANRIFSESATIDVLKKLTREKAIDSENTLLIMGQKAFVIYTEALSALQNLHTFSQKFPNRRCILRIVSSWKIKDLRAWRLFQNEFTEAVQVSLKNENKWGDDWSNWISKNNYTTIGIEEFTLPSESPKMESSRFIFVPDVQITKDWFEFPLQMDYECVWLYSRTREKIYPLSQAIYLITQKLAGDVSGMENMLMIPNRQNQELLSYKQRLINEMKQLEGEFVPAKKIDDFIEKFKQDPFYKKHCNSTALSMCRSRKFDDFITSSEFSIFVNNLEKDPMDAGIVGQRIINFLGIDKPYFTIQKIEVWKVRYVCMYRLFCFFMYKEPGIQTAALSAWTMNITAFEINNMDDFENMRRELERALDISNREKNQEIMKFASERMLKLSKLRNQRLKMDKIQTEDAKQEKVKIETAKTGKIQKEDDNLLLIKNKDSEDFEIEKTENEMKETREKLFEKQQKLIESLKTEISENNKISTAKYDRIKEELQDRKLHVENIRRETNNQMEIYAKQIEGAIKDNEKLKESYIIRGTRINELQLDLKKARENAKTERNRANNCSEKLEEANKNVTNLKKELKDLQLDMKNELKEKKLMETNWKEAKIQVAKLENKLHRSETLRKEEIESIKYEKEDLEVQLARKSERILEFEESSDNQSIEHARKLSEFMNENEQLKLRIDEITESSAVLLSQNQDQKDIRIKELEMRLNMLETWYRAGIDYFNSSLIPIQSIFPIPNSPSVSIPERCQLVENKMKQYQEIIESNCDKWIDCVDISIRRFANVSGRSKSTGLANHEFSKFKKQYQAILNLYRQEYNRIQNDINLKLEDLKNIPRMPQLSNRFLQTYESLLKKQRNFEKVEKNKPVGWINQIVEENEEKELEDLECLICACDMDENDERLTKCSNCHRKYHNHCLSDWLKTNSICPVCRKSLPDPESFPSLY
ncbi:unnamed protein product [Caenorhabditis angaria]|uniref:RING-type domain-containing protein n=1 Tax=Caenorhabditis angaria TaxID=860376 RepID=A0A9P1I5Y1_9PELO|nr:unnamed protein product [Caenorhabditis angaria]